MGVLDAIRARRVDMSERIQFVDRDGELLAEMPDSEFNDRPDDTEIPREDLADVLRAALNPATVLRFGESIADLHHDGDVVDVRFTSGERQHYDIVVGADGMHSATRGLVFGGERSVPAAPRLLCGAGRTARPQPVRPPQSDVQRPRPYGRYRDLSR